MVKVTKYVYVCQCGQEWYSSVIPTFWGEMCKECGEFASWQGKMFNETKTTENHGWKTEQLPNIVEEIIKNKEKYKTELIIFIIAVVFFFATQLISNQFIAILLQVVIIMFIFALASWIKTKTSHYI